jgi:hypothetical protein
MCRSGFSANIALARNRTNRKQPKDNRETRVLSIFIMLSLVGSERLSITGSCQKSIDPRELQKESGRAVKPLMIVGIFLSRKLKKSSVKNLSRSE